MISAIFKPMTMRERTKNQDLRSMMIGLMQPFEDNEEVNRVSVSNVIIEKI